MTNETEVVVDEPQKNVINYNPVFPVMTSNVILDLPVEDMSHDILQLATDIKNYEGGFTTYFNKQNIDSVRGVKELKEAIYGVCCAVGRELKYEMQYEKCSIELWASVMRRGGYHPPHAHPRSTFSGTFYARVDDKMSPLVMMNPTTPFRSHDHVIRPQDVGPFTSDTLMLKPAVNTMFIWPSWMHHFVPEMTESGPRISLSFNVDFLPPGA